MVSDAALIAALAAAELYGRQRDQGELQAERAVQIALYAKLAAVDIDWGGPVPAIALAAVPFEDALYIWLSSMALSGWNAAHPVASPTRIEDHKQRKAWVEMMVAEKAQFIDKLVDARVARLTGPPPPPSEMPDQSKPNPARLVGTNSGWARSVARTEATRAASESINEMTILAMGEELGHALTPDDESKLWKVWISRGDANVRELHRKLHGAPVRGVEKPYWTWTTGQQLRWPGDPLAPYSTIVNCRCIQWVMPSMTNAADIGAAFKPANLDTAFDVGAAPSTLPLAAHAHPAYYGSVIGDATPEYDVVMTNLRSGILELHQ